MAFQRSDQQLRLPTMSRWAKTARKLQIMPSLHWTMHWFRGEICPCRHCRRQCKIFVQRCKFLHFHSFFCVFITKTVEIRWNWRCKSFNLKFRRWKFWTNLMCALIFIISTSILIPKSWKWGPNLPAVNVVSLAVYYSQMWTDTLVTKNNCSLFTSFCSFHRTNWNLKCLKEALVKLSI